MKLKAVIEIPKGNDRRWHLNYTKTAIEDFGPIKEKIPVNDGIMPVAYGYLENTVNEEEKDNVDVLVFSTKEYTIGEETEVTPFGYIHRDDGDHKILTVDKTVAYESWSDVPKEERDLILEYFGYNHKILSIENREVAEEYIKRTTV
jgi:inorganic pyrophosphatase